MPKVPLISGQQVQQAPLPANGYNANVPNASGAIAGGVTAIGVGFGAYQDAEKAKADDAVLLDRVTVAKRQRIDVFNKFNPLTRHASVGASESVKADYVKFLGEIRAGLTTDQQLEFDNYAAKEELALYEDVERRVGEETRGIEDDGDELATKTAIEDAQQAAVTGGIKLLKDGDVDARSVQRARDDIAEQKIRYYARNADRFGGMDNAIVLANNAIDDATSQMHSAVIDAMVARKEDLAAEAYFKKYGGEMSAGARMKFTQTVAEATEDGAVLRLVDEAVLANSSPDDLRTSVEREESARALAKERFKDQPKLQKRALADISTEFSRKRNADNIRHNEEFEQLKAGLDKSFSLADVQASPAYKHRDFPQDMRDALVTYAEDKALGTIHSPEEQAIAYGALVMKYGSKNPKLVAEALEKSPHQLHAEGEVSEKQYKLLLPIYEDLMAERRGEERASTDDSYRTINQIVNDVTSIIYSSKRSDIKEVKADLVANFRTLMDNRFQNYKHEHDGDIPSEEWMLNEAQKLAAQKIIDTTGWDEPGLLLNDADLIHIPAIHLQRIYESLSEGGRKEVTDDDIEDEWDRVREDFGL
jgi:hypothetical protein